MSRVLTVTRVRFSSFKRLKHSWIFFCQLDSTQVLLDLSQKILQKLSKMPTKLTSRNDDGDADVAFKVGGDDALFDLVVVVPAIATSVARWQNLIPSFLWIAPGWRGHN